MHAISAKPAKMAIFENQTVVDDVLHKPVV